MSMLHVYTEEAREISRHSRYADIAAVLDGIGVGFERWEASQPLSSHASQEEVLRAYAEQVERLNSEYGFESVDVVSLRPDNPQRRHPGEFSTSTLDDFEIRFFVRGRDLFYHTQRQGLRHAVNRAISSVSRPGKHWFDMGGARFQVHPLHHAQRLGAISPAATSRALSGFERWCRRQHPGRAHRHRRNDFFSFLRTITVSRAPSYPVISCARMDERRSREIEGKMN